MCGGATTSYQSRWPDQRPATRPGVPSLSGVGIAKPRRPALAWSDCSRSHFRRSCCDDRSTIAGPSRFGREKPSGTSRNRRALVHSSISPIIAWRASAVLRPRQSSATCGRDQPMFCCSEQPQIRAHMQPEFPEGLAGWLHGRGFRSSPHVRYARRPSQPRCNHGANAIAAPDHRCC